VEEKNQFCAVVAAIILLIKRLEMIRRPARTIQIIMKIFLEEGNVYDLK
jgi:hypothetical protein